MNTTPTCECGGKSDCVDSRLTEFGRRRRYRCQSCHQCFSTMEVKVKIQNKQNNFIANGLKTMFGDRAPDLIKELEKVLGAFKQSGGDVR